MSSAVRTCVAAALLAVSAGCGNRAPIEPDPIGRARSLNAAGMRSYHEGELEEAEMLFLEALSEASALDDLPGKAAALHNLASVHRETGRLASALEESALSIDVMERAGNPEGVARSRALRSQVLLASGDIGAAEAEVLEALRSSGRPTRGELQAVLAGILIEKGDRKGAVDAGETGLALDPEGAVRADLLFQLARAHLLEGRTRKAEELLETGLEIDRALGRRRAVADTLALLGRAACLEGDVDRALAYLERAAGVYDGLGLTEAAAASRADCEPPPRT
jgi:tetratricopeptide (TPR) repeat protein